MMKSKTAAFVALVALTGSAFAQDAIEPETLTVKETIDEGPNLFVLSQEWKGPSSINVLGAEDFAMKGNMGPGTTAQMVLSADGKTMYTTSVYFERYTYGSITNVFHTWDVDTLKIKGEFEFGDKMAHVESQPALLALSSDEAYALAQNATPATSVSVIDIAAGSALAEIPTPGCWGIFPSTSGMKFTTICGDGTFQTYSYAADGTFGDPGKSEKIFDVDDDALFTNGVRVGDTLVYVSYNGNLYVVDDSGEVPVLSETIALTEGVLGKWAPSGSELIAYNAPTNTAFVLMHSGSYDGSHKNGAEQIWAVDMDSKTVVGRAAAHHENGLIVTQTEEPMLYGANEEGEVYLYSVEMGDEVFLEVAEEFNIAGWPTVMELDR
ncbi:amine dehydrogenase large subunit [Celeribacter naphthalenivorans]|uniref:amine dehydrogenase large subunit n=1 Tax=Celeribacter naphthalenivorans TaxID=1614694 RepID=UPI001CF9BCF6|nr:amine dehydrogenase large subunit [Celeribacter naphthalenivorans]